MTSRASVEMVQKAVRRPARRLLAAVSGAHRAGGGLGASAPGSAWSALRAETTSCAYARTPHASCSIWSARHDACTIDNLIHMANRIGGFFEAMPDRPDRPSADMASHMPALLGAAHAGATCWRMWTRDGGEGLEEIVLTAIRGTGRGWAQGGARGGLTSAAAKGVLRPS